MKRIQEQEKGPREKKVEPKPATPVAPVKTTAVQPVRRPPTAARQVSEDDEIARIKRENKAAGSSQAPAATETPSSILKKATPTADETATDVSQVL
jgi:tripartite motif-containing protein 71